LNEINSILVVKHIFYICIFIVLFLAPSYLARANGKDAYNMLIVRMSSWLLGWTLIGWLFALYWAVKK